MHTWQSQGDRCSGKVDIGYLNIVYLPAATLQLTHCHNYTLSTSEISDTLYLCVLICLAQQTKHTYITPLHFALKDPWLRPKSMGQLGLEARMNSL